MRRSLLALCPLLVVGSIAFPAVASPQPSPVCGACGAGFEDAAAREDFDLTVVESTATIQVHDDGSATWWVTNRLQNGSAAASLRNKSQALDTIVTYSIRRSSVEGPIENQSARVDGKTVIITFEDRYATTEMPGGVHVLEYFHSRGYESWYVVTADRITVVGPPDTVVANEPQGATVRGRNATWTGNASAPLWDAPMVEQDAYVAFAEPGAAAPALTSLALALATLPIVVDVLVSIHLPPLLLFGLALAGITAVARFAEPRLDGPRGLAVVIGAAGVAALALLLLSSGEGVRRMALGFGAVALAMAGVTLARDGHVQLRELVSAAALALAVVAVGAFLTVTNELFADARALDAMAETLRPLPLLVAPVLGATLVDGDRRGTVVAWALALAAFLTVELLMFSPSQRPFGLVVFLLGIYALVIAAISLPFVLLGATVERKD